MDTVGAGVLLGMSSFIVPIGPLVRTPRQTGLAAPASYGAQAPWATLL